MGVFAMKIRIKFSKVGKVKFIGHLDLLRLFQKIIKSSRLPIAYSKGFNPHPLIYFAQALSVGITSEGEYLDIHLKEDVNPETVKEDMNKILPEGIRVEGVYILPEDGKTCMALIDSASYIITINKTGEDNKVLGKLKEFYSQEEILYKRISKKKERIINIKDFIYELEIKEGKLDYKIHLMLASGSRKNLNAKLFMQSFIDDSGLELDYSIHRKELYSMQDGKYLPLWKLGV